MAQRHTHAPATSGHPCQRQMHRQPAKASAAASPHPNPNPGACCSTTGQQTEAPSSPHPRSHARIHWQGSNTRMHAHPSLRQQKLQPALHLVDRFPRACGLLKLRRPRVRRGTGVAEGLQHNGAKHVRVLVLEHEVRDLLNAATARDSRRRHRDTETWEIERQRGREAQRPRGPEAQRPRGPEAQRPRGPEAQRPRGPEAQRHRGTKTRNDTCTHMYTCPHVHRSTHMQPACHWAGLRRGVGQAPPAQNHAWQRSFPPAA